MTFDTEGAQPPTMLTGPTATLELMRGVSDAVAIKDQTLAGGLSPPAGCPHEVSLGGLLRALGSLIDNVRDNRRLCEEQRMAGIDLGHRGTDALGHVLEHLLVEGLVLTSDHGPARLGVDLYLNRDSRR